MDVSCNARSTTIPGRLFVAIPPGALQHLSLENYSVDWTALLPLGVTHHLSGLRSVHLARLWPPLPSDFLDILLSTAPRLESPHLLDTLPDDLYFPSRCRWHTSSLRSCHLEGPLNLVSKIFLQIMSMLIRSDLRITFRSSYSGSPLSFPPDPATWSYYGESLQAVTCFINDSGLLEDKIVEVYKQEWRGSFLLSGLRKNLMKIAQSIRYRRRNFLLPSAILLPPLLVAPHSSKPYIFQGYAISFSTAHLASTSPSKRGAGSSSCILMSKLWRSRRVTCSIRSLLLSVFSP